MVNIHKIKQEICDIGDRLYKTGFCRRQRRQHQLSRQRNRSGLHADA